MSAILMFFRDMAFYAVLLILAVVVVLPPVERRLIAFENRIIAKIRGESVEEVKAHHMDCESFHWRAYKDLFFSEEDDNE